MGFLLRIPNLTVIEPGCNLEMTQAFAWVLRPTGPVYFRVVRCEVEDNELFDGYQFKVGKGVTAYDEGSDVGFVTTGYMIKTAKIAAEKLRKQGVRVRIDHHPSLKPFDRELLYDMAGKVSCMVTLENHCISGGLHSLVAEALVARGSGLRSAPSAPTRTTTSTRATSTTCFSATR